MSEHVTALVRRWPSKRVNTRCPAQKLKGKKSWFYSQTEGCPCPMLPSPVSDPTKAQYTDTRHWRWLGSSDQTPLSRGPKCLHGITASAVWSMRVSKSVFRTAENSKVEVLYDIPPSFRPRSILDWIHAFLLMEMPKDNKSVLLESTKGTQKCVLMPTCHWN